MPVRTVLVKLVFVVGLLVAACNPIPAAPAPMPAQTPVEPGRMQVSLKDFTGMAGKFDRDRDQEQYEEIIVETVDCLEDLNSTSTLVEFHELTPGEAHALQWFLIENLVLMNVLHDIESAGGVSNIESGLEYTVYYWLEDTRDFCLELD